MTSCPMSKSICVRGRNKRFKVIQLSVILGDFRLRDFNSDLACHYIQSRREPQWLWRHQESPSCPKMEDEYIAGDSILNDLM